jgi:hypothetical protein
VHVHRRRHRRLRPDPYRHRRRTNPRRHHVRAGPRWRFRDGLCHRLPGRNLRRAEEPRQRHAGLGLCADRCLARRRVQHHPVLRHSRHPRPLQHLSATHRYRGADETAGKQDYHLYGRRDRLSVGRLSGHLRRSARCSASAWSARWAVCNLTATPSNAGSDGRAR